MNGHHAQALITDAHVDAILTVLNASEPGLESLDELTSRTCLRSDRVIEGPDVTYVRLVGEAEEGGPIVLVHFEGVWERATRTSSPSPFRASAAGRSTAAEVSRPRARARQARPGMAPPA